MRSVDICGSHCNFTGFGIRHGGYTSQEPYILTGHRHPSISQLCLTGDPSDHDSIIEVFFDQFGLELSPEILATRWSMAADQIVDWFTVSGDNVFMMIIVIDVYCGYVYGWFGCLCFFSWRNGCKSGQQFQQRFISSLPLAFAIAQPGPEQTHPWQNTHCSSKRHCFSRESADYYLLDLLGVPSNWIDGATFVLPNVLVTGHDQHPLMRVWILFWGKRSA